MKKIKVVFAIDYIIKAEDKNSAMDKAETTGHIQDREIEEGWRIIEALLSLGD
jgi:hypothetical protein